MPKIEVTETVERPVEDVWVYLADPTVLPKWTASTQEVDLLSDGELTKGSRVRAVGRFLGRSIEFVLEVTQYEAPVHLGWRSVEGPFDNDVEYDLQSVGDSTRITMRAEAEAGLGGVFGKLLDPVVAAAYRRETQSDLGRLKDILETQAVEEAT